MSPRLAGPSGGSDGIFWELLGLEPGAGRGAIKRAYYKKARDNHPDFFPESEKALQEIKMIALNEAYAYLMSLSEEDIGTKAHRDRPGESASSMGPGPFTAEWSAPPAGTPAVSPNSPPTTALGFHKDPAYAYYKQGFVHFSRAIHGIEALYQSLTRYHRIHFRPRDDAYERFAGSLVELRRAHDYFTRVIEEHSGSIWRRDAELKLSRIARFSALYRRIIGNLARGS
jgi:curved DNA-binding protein CbpA